MKINWILFVSFVVTGIFFGFWQGSYLAGFTLFFILNSIANILEHFK